ncbi:aminotransferase class I/II-fold pyridoxal phosphate-dependent enzyme [Thiocystis violascens]|uniref:Aminotransferase n=1 Tax=Thiocystis violascens (strain ATCC 17096 / DSM 198 / 6111) TaxID=765911 RepID=I3YFS2_THIV6|nr:aminotransferase class I/II-fold pyridoxal phosphate-dependent enzyme [Thiocystis violascens]AFL75840.1 aspartate/tyrosine/aromatic aminotransferase [Thiocystis violascens DSM 198]
MPSVSDSHLAARAQAVEPFHVMRLLARARELEALGRSIVHLEIGEPDFPTPAPIVAAGQAALAEGRTLYTPAAGLPALRQAIAEEYGRRDGVDVEPARVLIAPGASGALQLAFSALLEPGDRVLIGDPSYPCYRQVLRLMGVEPVAVPLGPENDYRLTAGQAESAWGPGIRAVVVASPANPTGSVLDPATLAELYALCRARGAVLIVDEIYQGLTYETPARTALSIGSTDLYVINSFSKYFGMTGWRIGWAVAPREAAGVLERLAQNLYIAANTLAQHAALAAFDMTTLAIVEERRGIFQQRRDRLLSALRGLGFAIPHTPAGAFYLYAGLPERVAEDAMIFASRLLEEAGVAVTPGQDFGEHEAGRHVRFAYTRDLCELDEGVRRIGEFLSGC